MTRRECGKLTGGRDKLLVGMASGDTSRYGLCLSVGCRLCSRSRERKRGREEERKRGREEERKRGREEERKRGSLRKRKHRILTYSPLSLCG